jgi:hypothetical protein
MRPRTTRRRLLQQFAAGAAPFVVVGHGHARAQIGLHDRILGLRDYVTQPMAKWKVPGPPGPAWYADDLGEFLRS